MRLSGRVVTFAGARMHGLSWQLAIQIPVDDQLPWDIVTRNDGGGSLRPKCGLL